MTKTRKPLKRSFFLAMLTFILMLCVLLSLTQSLRYRSIMYKNVENKIENVLRSVAADIDVDDLSECIETGVKSEKYNALQKRLDGIRDNVDLHFIYIIVPLSTEPVDNIKNVIAGASKEEYETIPDEIVQLNSLTGDSYSSETAKEYLEAYLSGELSYFKEKSEWGFDYTGLLPLKSSDGKLVAALCVDIDINEISLTIAGNAVYTVIIICLSGFVLIALFYIWTARNVTRPLEQLEGCVSEYASSCKVRKDPKLLKLTVPDGMPKNEVGSLADAVLKMSDAMQFYVSSIVYTENQLAKMAAIVSKDALTGVKNKTAYTAYAIDLQRDLGAGMNDFAILVADLNGQKQVNLAYGNDIGDLYIRSCCSLICNIFTHSPVFRVGDDEFVVILKGIDYNHREELVSKLKTESKRLSANGSLKPWERCSIAVGCADCGDSPDRTVEDVFTDADRAMYKDKYPAAEMP